MGGWGTAPASASLSDPSEPDDSDEPLAARWRWRGRPLGASEESDELESSESSVSSTSASSASAAAIFSVSSSSSSDPLLLPLLLFARPRFRETRLLTVAVGAGAGGGAGVAGVACPSATESSDSSSEATIPLRLPLGGAGRGAGAGAGACKRDTAPSRKVAVTHAVLFSAGMHFVKMATSAWSTRSRAARLIRRAVTSETIAWGVLPHTRASTAACPLSGTSSSTPQKVSFRPMRHRHCSRMGSSGGRATRVRCRSPLLGMSKRLGSGGGTSQRIRDMVHRIARAYGWCTSPSLRQKARALASNFVACSGSTKRRHTRRPAPACPWVSAHAFSSDFLKRTNRVNLPPLAIFNTPTFLPGSCTTHVCAGALKLACQNPLIGSGSPVHLADPDGAGLASSFNSSCA